MDRYGGGGAPQPPPQQYGGYRDSWDRDREHRDRDSSHRDKDRDKDKDRDRDRDSKDRSRSRSRSRSPRHHRDNRSPEGGSGDAKPRLRPRQSSGWDAKPAGAESLPPAALAAMLAPKGTSQPGDNNRRKLYIGSVPASLTEAEIMEAALQRMRERGCWGANPLGPVASVQVNYEKQYAFMEFRTPDDATAGLDALDGLPVGGTALRFRRPRNYTEDAGCGVAGGPAYALAASQNISAVLSPALIAQLRNPTPQTILDLTIPGAALTGAMLPPGDEQQAALCGPATSVVVLCNVGSEEELHDEDTYRTIVDDMRAAAAEHGAVISVHVPRPYRALAQQLQEPIGDLPQPRHVGKCFVEYYEVDDAQRALRALAGRSYAGRTIIAKFWEPAQLDRLREENERAVQRAHDMLAEALRVQRKKRQENPFFALPPPGGSSSGSGRPLSITSGHDRRQDGPPLAIEAPPPPQQRPPPPQQQQQQAQQQQQQAQMAYMMSMYQGMYGGYPMGYGYPVPPPPPGTAPAGGEQQQAQQQQQQGPETAGPPGQ
eukprot:m51a1_g9211 putative splicing factor u2af 50 kda subunit-like (544) ;mRNA; r:27444-29832